jgi:hypothetical protein
MTARAFFEPLRKLLFGGISGTYASIGVPTLNGVRAFRIINNTEGDMTFTDDITVVDGKWFLPAGTFVLYDVQANMNAKKDDKFELSVGTQFSVKEETAPLSGSVRIELLH